MRKIILATQMTLDGYIAGPNDEMDWLITSQDEWTEMFKDLESVDTCMLGGTTYPGYSGYWRSVLTNPNSDANELAYARWADRTEHVVFSKTIKSTDWSNTRILTNLKSEIPKLKQAPGKDIIVWGGAAFASSLINLGAVDEYRISLNPTILGKGKALFNNLSGKKRLSLLDARPLNSGMIILRYRAVD